MICEKEYAFFLQILQKSRIQSKEFPLSGEQDLEIDAVGLCGMPELFPPYEAGHDLPRSG